MGASKVDTTMKGLSCHGQIGAFSLAFRGIMADGPSSARELPPLYPARFPRHVHPHRGGPFGRHWDKFAEISKKLSSWGGNIYGSTIYVWGSSQLLMEAQRGKPIIDAKGKIDYDNAILRSFAMRKGLEDAKAMWPLNDMKVTKTHYSKAFYDGRAAMLLIGEWFPGFMISGRDKNLLQGFTWNDWGVTRLPCDEKSYSTFGSPTFNHVTSYAKNKEAAFKFIA